MPSLRTTETILQWLKRVEAIYYRSGYQSLKELLVSIHASGHAQYRETLAGAIPKPEEVRSILVFKPDDIGDAVHSLPSIAELKRYYHRARLFLICQRTTEALFERCGLFDEISTVEVKKVLLRFPFISLKEGLAQFSREQFDISVFLRTYPAFFSYFLKIPAWHKVHPLDPRLRSDSPLKMPVSLWGERREHQAYQLLEIASFLSGNFGVLSDIKYPSFHWQKDDKEALSMAFGKSEPKRFFVVHPYARFETRRYPMDFWAEILTWLKKKYRLPVVVIGGEEDDPLPVEGLVQMQGRLLLGQSGYLMSRAAAFLGNESGPAHWAAALGVPTVVFFGGHSAVCEWAPRGTVKLIHQDVECSPCHRRVCPGYGLKCLMELSPSFAIPQLEPFLSHHSK